MQLTSLESLRAAVNGTTIDVPDDSVVFGGVSVDSRTIQSREVFWCLKGDHFDGHDFVASLADRDVPASVVASHRVGQTRGPRIVVPRTDQALADFAAWYRRRLDTLVIGVTGSVGKTTTRSMIHHVLGSRFRGVQSPKNFNNHYGVPLSLLQIEDEDEFAVLEFGASARGEIARLVALADIEIGVVTAVGLAHVGGFGTPEDIFEEKSELVAALPRSGFAVLPGDQPWSNRMTRRTDATVISVGENADNDLRARHVLTTNDGLRFMVDRQEYRLPLLGKHHLTNALAAIAIGRELGLREQEIADRLATFAADAGRGQRLELGPWTVIDETYNASPCSMRAACDLLKNWNGTRRRILVCGDMLELGDQTHACHEELGFHAAQARLDHLLVIGEFAEQVIRGARRGGMARFRLAACRDLESALLVLDCWLEPQDVVLVKGSRALRLERVVEWLRQQVQAAHLQTSAGALTPAWT